MNIGMNCEEAKLVYDALGFYFKSTQVPEILLSCYPGADLKCLFRQLEIVVEAGEKPDEHLPDWLKGD